MTIVDAVERGIAWHEIPAYIVGQIIGAFVGVGAANVMFELPVYFDFLLDPAPGYGVYSIR